MLKTIKWEIDINTIIVGDFNTPLTRMLGKISITSDIQIIPP